jgi:hypothetical protein
MEFRPDKITFAATVRGEGRVATVQLLGGARLPKGMLPSGAEHRTVFSPNPDHPWRIARPAVEPAVISVNGEGGEPGVAGGEVVEPRCQHPAAPVAPQRRLRTGRRGGRPVS